MREREGRKEREEIHISGYATDFGYRC